MDEMVLHNSLKLTLSNKTQSLFNVNYSFHCHLDCWTIYTLL